SKRARLTASTQRAPRRRSRPSFPTRRSSDLEGRCRGLGSCDRDQVAQRAEPRERLALELADALARQVELVPDRLERPRLALEAEDRKSTRLNSSHVASSYAVVRLEKKKLVPA